jgi:hypothetical protein
MSARISRVLPFVLALGLGTTAAGFGCKAKPSEKACREAIENIRKISGQSANEVGADPVASIRSCRGNSSKAAVECWRLAKSEEDLKKCEGASDLAGKEAPEGKTEAPAAQPVPEPTDEEAPALDPVGHEAAATGGEAAKTEPGNAQPAAAAPTAAEPTAAEPTAAEPTAAAPANTEPAKAEPAAP